MGGSLQRHILSRANCANNCVAVNRRGERRGLSADEEPSSSGSRRADGVAGAV